MFSSRVLELTKQIPKGRVSTYGDIARALENPKAARAVGNALNKNPHPVTVPCHRVVRSDGDIGGYAFGKGEKVALLEKEGIKIKRGKVADFDNLRWIFEKISRGWDFHMRSIVKSLRCNRMI